MKIIIQTVAVFLFFCGVARAQDLPITLPTNLDIQNIDPSQVPNKEVLQNMGVSDTDIEKVDVLKQKANSGQDVTSEIEAIKAEKNNAEETKKTLAEQEEKKALKAREEEEKIAKQKAEEEKEIKNTNSLQFPPNQVYGHDFFSNGNITFYQKASDIKAADNYILGTGDKLNIVVWGFAEYNEVFEINEEGAVYSKELGRVYLKGLPFSSAKSLLISRAGSFLDLSNSKIDITLVHSRIITINIVGEVIRSGSYTIPAINTAFNAMIAAGGINNLGSVRNIYIRRNGKTVKTLDVYEFLQNPDSRQEYFLEDNDYIFVPFSSKVVKISGMVKRPSSFELKENENLQSIIKYAGGLQPNASTKNIQIVHIKDHKEILIDLNLDSLIQYKKDFKLYNGDQVTIRPIPAGYSNYLDIKGAVQLPGSYEFEEGMRVSDLIEKAEGLAKDVYVERAYIHRIMPDLSREYIAFSLDSAMRIKHSSSNLLLKNLDILSIFSVREFKNYGMVSIDGSVRKPGSFPFGVGMTLKDLMYLSGGVNPDIYLDRAFILRYRPDATKYYIPISVDTTNNYGSMDSIVLQMRDKVLVYSKSSYIETDNISVTGLVRVPGTFYYADGMTLEDALFLGGGLKREAAKDRIEVARMLFFDKTKKSSDARTTVFTTSFSENGLLDSAARSFKLLPFDQIYVRANPDFEIQSTVTILGEVKYPGTYPIIAKKEKVSDLIKRAGGLTDWAFVDNATMERMDRNIGFMFIDLKKILKKPNVDVDYKLINGDQIVIPKINQLVSLEGALDYPEIKRLGKLNLPYHKGTRAKFYIKKYGAGFADNAKKSSTYVLHPNGIVKKTNNFLLFNVYPKIQEGDKIYVNVKVPRSERRRKIKKQKPEKDPVEWNKHIDNFIARTTGVLTILLLLNAAGLR